MGCYGGNQGNKYGSSGRPASESLDSSFVLGYDQTAVIKSEKLTIRFANVPEDSRCPVGVRCIRAGEAMIDLEMQKGKDKPETVQVISEEGRPELAEKIFNRYLIKLVKVEPPRTTERELQLPDYEITLQVSKRQ